MIKQPQWKLRWRNEFSAHTPRMLTDVSLDTAKSMINSNPLAGSMRLPDQIITNISNHGEYHVYQG